MADATTTNYSLTKPEVGASNDTWGDKLNDNFDDIDSLLGGGTAVAGINITSGTISGITDLAVADGGTGASDASGARTNLGLGSISTQASSSVSITGGSMSGVALSSCSGNISQFTNNSGYVTSSGVTSVATGTGLTGGTITSTGTLSLATAGSGAATYSSGISAITVDAYGRVTSVSGSAGYTANTGDITGVTAGNGLTGGGSSGSVSLAMSGSFTGSFTASGDVTAYSDERLKDNVETLDGSKVLQMRGVSFTKDGKAGSGVIAQELEKIAPELVHTADDEMGTKSVAYGNLVGYLIEAVKELSEKVKKLEES